MIRDDLQKLSKEYIGDIMCDAWMEKIVGVFKEYIEDHLKEWPEPLPGAGEGLGPLAGTGMYMQYDEDRKKRREEIKSLLEGLEKEKNHNA